MTVHLVGAGPGDPGLLTVRGAELLRRADVVVYDRLSAAMLLDLAPTHAELISVGKGPGRPSTPQSEINRLLVDRGSDAATTVVRLKGGDPFVFARGGEEVDALLAAGIAVEVVPGITSAIAAPAYAGIPVTRRYSSTSFTVVTGHEDPSKGETEVDWESIARVGGTIVILMGVANVATITGRLIAGGLSPETPAAAVRWGTLPVQHTIRATLATLAHQPLIAPSVIVVGEVAHDHLDWFESRPLFGRRIVITRAAEQSSRLADALGAAGASVISVPSIEIADASDGGAALRAAAERVADFEWVVLSSPNGARRFLDAVGDPRRLAGTGLAAIGPGTAAVLTERSLVADLVPDRYVAEGLVEAFPERTVGRHGAVLLPRAAVARDVLPEGLRSQGWEVEIVEAYRTLPASLTATQLEAVEEADAVAFASSSAVRSFVAAVATDRRPSVAIVIGPITAETARACGFATVVESEEPTIQGLVAAACAWSR